MDLWTQSRRGLTALRDLLLISLAVASLLWLGAVTGVYGAIYDWLERRFDREVGAILVALALASVGLAVFAIRLWRSGQREAAARVEAESRFRTLVEKMPAVTYTWDPREPAGTLPPPYVSPQVQAILGFSVEEWRADPRLWIEQIHAEDRDRVLAASNRSDRTGEPFEIEYRHVKPNGTVIWVREEAIVVERDEHGRPSLVQGLMIDITEQKLAEEKVRAAELRYRSLVEHMPVVTYLNDRLRDPSERYISPGIERLLGYTQTEWLADPHMWQTVLHPDDRERVLAEFRASNETGEPFSSEYRMVASDGSDVWVHDDAHIVERGPTGDGSVWQGVFVNVTRRKEAEFRLREAEETYRTLVEQLPVVVYQDAIDDTSTALYISPQYERMFGFPPEARLRDPDFWVNHLHPDDREWVLAESRRTNETGEPFAVEYRFLGSHGRVVWVRDEAVLLRDADGRPSHWQGVLMDVTERKLAEETLSRRDAVLEAVGFAAERFLKTSEWKAALPEVLERLGSTSGVSRVYVYENEPLEDGRLAMTLRQEWLADGVGSLDQGPSHRHPYAEGFARWEAALSGGRSVHGLTRDFPADERAILEPEAVVSQVVVPVFVGDRWWGFLGFDDCQKERAWPPAEIEALKTAADTLGAAIRRTRAEAERSEAERRYRTLVETMPAVTYMQGADPGAPVYYVSPQIESMLGYTQEEWGPSFEMWRDTIHPQDRERVIAADEESDRTGEPYVVEYRQKHKDGRWIWVHDEAALVRDDDGRPLYWQGIRFDITAQEHAEQHLREAKERFRTLVENLPAVTYIDDIDERSSTIYVSPQIETLFGYTPREWTKNADLWIEALHPDDRDAVLAAVARHNDLGEPFDIEYRLRAKDGRWTWVSDHATVVRGQDGRILFSQGVMFNITERRLAEEHMRETEAKYRALVEHIPAVLYIDPADERSPRTYVSPQVVDVLGISQEEYLEHEDLWRELVHPDDREWMFAAYKRSLEAKEGWAVEYRIVRPDGQVAWIRDESAFLFGEDGAPVLVQGVMFDITERKLAEEALQKSERREREAAERLRALDEMKNTFLAAVSHELRSPLTSILGLALTLEQQQLAAEDQRDLTGRLAQNARKLDRLLKDLLDIDRLSRGIVTPQLRRTDLGALVRRTIDSLETGERRVSVEVEAVVVPVDPAKFERIVENLVINAVRHTEPEATVWVRVWSEDDGAVLAVEDDGPGVPADLQTAIFEPFRQGPTASPHSPGTGIGLSLVAMFTDLHGGRAWVQDRDGGGASFRVFLPAAPASWDGDRPSRHRVAVRDAPSAVDRARAG